MIRDVVVVMAKTPVGVQVKTRLHPVLGPEGAVEVARAMLLDTLDNARGCGADVVVATAGDLAAMQAVVGGAARMIPQRGADLAERLSAVQQDLFDAGMGRVLLLGADCPTVSTSLLAEALDTVPGGDAATGPTEGAMVRASDGGYVLLVTNGPTPTLFDGVVMGRSDVAEQTVAAALRSGVPLQVLGTRYDLDRVEDFAAATAAGQLDDAPRTRAVVAGWTRRATA